MTAQLSTYFCSDWPHTACHHVPPSYRRFQPDGDFIMDPRRPIHADDPTRRLVLRQLPPVQPVLSPPLPPLPQLQSQPPLLPLLRQMPGHYHWLLHLPPAFWARMHRYLDYADIVRLAQLSAQFRHVQLQDYLPWTVRHAAVARRDREAAALIAKKDGSQTCACYICFRMKPIGKFQRQLDAYTFARVLQRDPYTGRRILEPVPEPEPGEAGNVVQPPSMPASPVGMGVGGVGVGVAVGVGYGGTMGMSMGAMGMPSGSVVRMPDVASPGMGGFEPAPVLHVPTSLGLVTLEARPSWTPQAPGAEVGQIESLRRYCTQCALNTHLLVPADVTTTQDGKRLWVCRCRKPWPETVRRCNKCGMNQVFRD